MFRPSRRRFLKGTAVAGLGAAATSLLGMPAIAQSKPAKIVVTGLQISWRRTFEEEIGPAFEQQHGIPVEFEWLPQDALAARLKTQAGSAGGGIDVAWINTGNANTMSGMMTDFGALMQQHGTPDDFDLDDVLPAAMSGYNIGGRQIGMPFRYTTYLMHYQPEVLEQAGITSAPTTFAEYRNAGLAVTEKFGPDRYGIGVYGRESEAMVRGWHCFLLSSGGNYYNPQTWEILVNQKAAVDSLQFYGDLIAKDKVVPPESATWEWDGLTSGAQADRFAMTVTIGPYGTAMNNPEVSKTGGKWAWSRVPGATDPSQSAAPNGGWAMAIPESSPNKDWAYQFIIMATTKTAMKSTTKDGNAPPRFSVLNDAEVVQRYGWAPAFSEQAKTAVDFPVPSDPIFTTVDQQIRPHMSRVLLGQASAQEAMDAAAAEWKRTLSRANLI